MPRTRQTNDLQRKKIYVQRKKLRAAESSYQAFLLREIFGNPFSSVTICPAGFSPEIKSLADAIYDERAF